MRNLVCCNNKIKCGEVLILNDIKGFTARKLYKAKCPKCKDDVVTLIETRVSDNKIFVNANITGLEAVKVLYREKKRILATLPDIKSDVLFGWIYGHNVEIRNKNKQVTQIRQYAKDFSGNKNLTKKVYLS